MPVERMNWGVAVEATLRAAIPHFFETGRAHAAGVHFLPQPLWGHNYSCAGAPNVFATHVLGHALLIEQLRLLLAPGRVHDDEAGGRVVWSGSRAASAAHLVWEALAPPPAEHEGEVNVTGGHGESYGEAKFATDLYSVSAGMADLASASQVQSVVVCPGAVMTHLTPAILQLLKPVLVWFRPFLPGFNMTLDRGIMAHAAAAVARREQVGGVGVKYVMWWGGLVPASNGAPAVTPPAAARMGQLVKAWLGHGAWAGK
ncbi:HSD17B7 [Symbiodinium sp. KB8]|nr:HSD17B7 [Symbiodinium sp. KB8]